LDKETNLYYYGSRYYDPRISMFYGVYLLAEKYSFKSPFAYAANNPVVNINENGKGAKTTIVEDEEGNRKVVVETTITIYQQKGGGIDLEAFASTLS